MELLEKLQKIQIELKVNKGQRNNFGKYNYRSAEDILEAIKPFEEKYKVVFQITEEIKEVSGLPFIESRAIISDLKTKETESSIGTALIDLDAKGMQMPQRTGSASSYAKKYALGNLLLIDDTKDSDALNTHSKTVSKPHLRKGSKAFADAREHLKKGTVTVDQIKKHYNVTDSLEKELLK